MTEKQGFMTALYERLSRCLLYTSLQTSWKGGVENAGRSGKQNFDAGCQWNKVYRQNV